MSSSALTIPMWTLLGFAAWTLIILIATVGTYRWGNILFRKARIASFRSDMVEGADWYRRGMRAHANCVENLPVFGVIVFVITAIGLESPTINYLCTAVLVARICQSIVHISHEQTDSFVAVRFTFFSVQLVCFLALIALVVSHSV